MTKREAADVVRAVKLVAGVAAETFKLGRLAYSVGWTEGQERVFFEDVTEAGRWIVARTKR